jgi:hypothetical protein
MTVCPYLETCEQKICLNSFRLCVHRKTTDGIKFNVELCNRHNIQNNVNNSFGENGDKRIRKTPKEWGKDLKEQVNFT